MTTLVVKVKMNTNEKEDEEVRDFVTCHPMPSSNDEEGEAFWKKVINRMKSGEGVKDMTIYIYMFVNFDIVKQKCMNTSLIKKSSLIVERNLTEMDNLML